MYLEIADRRSGKTTRLIKKLKEVYAYAQENNTCGKVPLLVLMGISKTSTMYILKTNDLEEDNYLRVVCTAEELRDQLRGRPDRDIHLFVDEFDYSVAFEEFINGTVKLCEAPIICSGYYTSSRRAGSDVVSKLMEYAPQG